MDSRLEINQPIPHEAAWTLEVPKPVCAREEKRCIKSQNVEYWSKRAPGYSFIHQKQLQAKQYEKWQRALINPIAQATLGRSPKNVRVLDVGCGPGFFSIILANAGYEVTAVDYTTAMLSQARHNAGELATHINFCAMDAEQLAFDEGSFDAVVTRNLLWNLPHPRLAYAEWHRVLGPGGVLVNFDANWYRHLRDKRARREYLLDRARMRSQSLRDEYALSDVCVMESIAQRVPLTYRERPGWDIGEMERLGMEQIEVDENAGEHLWSDAEKISYRSTPLFCVTARKPSRE